MNGCCPSCRQSSECCTCDSASNCSESSWTTAEISCPQYSKPRNGCPQNTMCMNTFVAMVSPVTNLVSTKHGLVMFNMRKKAGVVSLSWEPFSGVISANGTDSIQVQQTIPQMPQVAHDYMIRGQLKGNWTNFFVRVDPSASANLAFYLGLAGTGGLASTGDTFNIPATTINWIL